MSKHSLLEITLEGKSKENLITYLKSLDGDLEIKSIQDEPLGVSFILKPKDERFFKNRLLENLGKEGITLNTLKRQEVTLEQMFLTNI